MAAHLELVLADGTQLSGSLVTVALAKLFVDIMERQAEAEALAELDDEPDEVDELDDERAAYLEEVRRGSRLDDLPPELADPAQFAR